MQKYSTIYLTNKIVSYGSQYTYDNGEVKSEVTITWTGVPNLYKFSFGIAIKNTGLIPTDYRLFSIPKSAFAEVINKPNVSYINPANDLYIVYFNQYGDPKSYGFVLFDNSSDVNNYIFSAVLHNRGNTSIKINSLHTWTQASVLLILY